MKTWQPTLLAITLLAAFPATAQSNADILKEIRALKDKAAELEQRLQATEAQNTEQQQELGRIGVKAEALEDARDAAGMKLLKISGYMDPTFIANKAQNTAGFQFLNRVDTNNGGDGYNFDNSYIGMAVLDLLKETDSGTRWHLVLAPNRGVGSVFDGNSPVQEASVSVPLDSPVTRLIAGQMPDWSGYEYLPAPQNKLITHNLLFDFTLPTAYTGAGLELTRGKWVVKGMLANMNIAKKSSGNKTPLLAFRADYAKSEYTGFGFAGVIGKAANFRADATDATGALLFPNAQGKDTAVQLFEVDGFFTRADWTLQGQLSVGGQKQAAISADPVTGELRDARWWGASALAAYKFTPRLEGTVRLDFVNNRKNGGGLLGYTAADGRNGIGPDPAGDQEVGANRSALAFGTSYLFDANTTLKVEYRLDRASLPVFEHVKDGSFRKDNQLFGAAVVVSF